MQFLISPIDATKLALREGHDVIDSAFTSSSTTSTTYNRLQFRSSEYTATTYDPYLEVTYTQPVTTTTTTTANEVTYTYDHGTQRVSKISDAATTYYPTSAYSVTDGVSTAYVNGSSGLVASIENNGTTSTTDTIHTDHLGSTSVVTDQDGVMIELLDYNPYGTERISWSSSSDDGEAESAKTYIGEYSDDETDLSYLNARYYDSQRGQFLSQDPVYLSIGSGTDKREQVALLDPQSQNGYLYGRGNPIGFRDDSGEFIETVLDIISIALSTYDYQRNSSFGNAIFLGLDLFGVIPGLPSGVGYVRHAAQVAKISKYFGDVAGYTRKASDVARAAGLFAKNIGFKFTGRGWSSGSAGNDVASLVGHFVKHGGEQYINASSVDDYYRKANEFIANTKSFNDPFETNGAGDMIHWDSSTNIKAVTTKDGTIKSYYTETRQDRIDTYNQQYAE